jgi:hypothetical protein
MTTKYFKKAYWDLGSLIIIGCFSLLQILRWRLFPQFIDIYYHLLTAWGFIQAGGYSGWDFWQYAPFGRIHIYPPFLHIVIAFLIKLGINKIILAKLLETAVPVIFLFVIWRFIRKNFSAPLAFFVLLTLNSSFSFYLSLINNLPSTFAIIFGLLAFNQLLQKKIFRCGLLLALSFYTHIGASWFFAIAMIAYGLMVKDYRKATWKTCGCAFLMSAPVLFKEFVGLGYISKLGFNIFERFYCEFKPVDYILALIGILAVLKMARQYKLFYSFFLASLIFLPYPYRFFSAQGYLPVALLSGVGVYFIYEKLKNNKIFLSLSVIYFLFCSLTVLSEAGSTYGRVNYKSYLFDSAFLNMTLPEMNKRVASVSLWNPDEYLSAADLIEKHSYKDDIIYSPSQVVGVCLASIAGRATVNHLFLEIDTLKKINPLAAARIIILPKDGKQERLKRKINKYNFEKIGENELFVLYKNPSSLAKIAVRRPLVSFAWIGLIALIFALLFLKY